MKPQQFVNKYMPFAKVIEAETGIPAIAIIAQSAFESGWGAKAIGNNIFGIKYRKGDWGKQEVLTTEYFENRKDFEKLNTASVEYHLDVRKFKVIIRAEFADYPTPLEGFRQHAALLMSNRYAHALNFANDPKMYLRKIAESGYATLPNYAEKMSDMVDSVIKRL